jgi:hypothetical protein
MNRLPLYLVTPGNYIRRSPRGVRWYVEELFEAPDRQFTLPDLPGRWNNYTVLTNPNGVICLRNDAWVYVE